MAASVNVGGTVDRTIDTFFFPYLRGWKELTLRQGEQVIIESRHHRICVMRRGDKYYVAERFADGDTYRQVSAGTHFFSGPGGRFQVSFYDRPAKHGAPVALDTGPGARMFSPETFCDIR